MTAAMDRQAIAAGVGSSFIFVLLNVSMNLYMKWLFAKDGGDFAFPWTMLAVQQLQAYMVLQPLIAWRYPTIRNCGWDVGGEHQRESGVGLTATIQVLAVTGLFCLNVGLNSLSLVKMSITLNQTVRAFLPVGVLLLATVLERRTYPRHSYYTTCVLIVGIGLTCWGSPHFEFNGFFLAFTSTIIAAAGSSLNGRLLNAGPFSKAGPGVIARLLMYQSVPAFIVFALVAYVSEGDRVRHAFSAPSAAAHRVLLISISSVLALMSNLGRCFLVAATSALMETLAGNAKVAALCIIDHQLFHTELHHYNYVGVAITFTGFSMHVLLQYASRPSELERDGPQKDMANKLALAERNEEQELEESNSKEPEAGTNGNSHEESNGDSNGDLHGRRHAPLNQPTIRLQPRPPLSLPLQISGGETGLISEQVAVRIGKPARKARRRRHLSSINEEDFDENRNEDTFHHQDHDHEQLETEDNRRMRASTWQAGSDPTKSWLGRVSDRAGVKLAPILEPPPWLSQEDAEDADMLPTSYSADAGFSREGPDRLSAHSPLVANGGAFLSEGSSRHRLRIWSDMTHCRADTPQLRPL
mmetsp:Transcript_56443/g.112166  ORF Transcript_56443/g.112166 Transcript_56443/m.112166 type:complete len:584 (-) Transcript_56443:166-1917(-)|eukprot:CAMPEP_0172749828 /NCGR_PEP_ID=MMETSP1074-20121228/148256_1 /TAXON_ID=2916 /ORGANISM="Ceratium fusus, Strain PA161109" /LENGTH=583 /DNA_ID=CAMNT_0013581861 /DNA_START=6 /DNA_END=1757 /DNA_ORIENTATION=+